jgi:hypothetical protein
MAALALALQSVGSCPVIRLDVCVGECAGQELGVDSTLGSPEELRCPARLGRGCLFNAAATLSGYPAAVGVG